MDWTSSGIRAAAPMPSQSQDELMTHQAVTNLRRSMTCPHRGASSRISAGCGQRAGLDDLIGTVAVLQAFPVSRSTTARFRHVLVDEYQTPTAQYVWFASCRPTPDLTDDVHRRAVGGRRDSDLRVRAPPSQHRRLRTTIGRDNDSAGQNYRSTQKS